jgi:hypothetical protein
MFATTTNNITPSRFTNVVLIWNFAHDATGWVSVESLAQFAPPGVEGVWLMAQSIALCTARDWIEVESDGGVHRYRRKLLGALRAHQVMRDGRFSLSTSVAPGRDDDSTGGN